MQSIKGVPRDGVRDTSVLLHGGAKASAGKGAGGAAHKAARSGAGFTLVRELNRLSEALDNPRRPVLTILGGELSEEKLAMAEAIARRSEVLLLGGEMCLPFLIAQGRVEARREVSEKMVQRAGRMLSAAKDDKRQIDVPVDFMTVARADLERMKEGIRFATRSHVSHTPARELRRDHVICDIGETTRWAWSGRLGFARTIFWHAPVGISEIKPFDEGTRFLATQIANRTWPGMHKTIFAGGSLRALLSEMRDIADRLHGLTTADRAALHYFAGFPLPEVASSNRPAERRANDSMLAVIVPDRETASSQVARVA
jgi:phosphoglycerate kinase